MAISVSQARQICTKAELDLVLQSTTRQIGDLDAKQLRASIRRARTLRDKWRELANAQTRDTKTEDPGNLGRANARSGEKAELFDEALTRFEKRLTKVDGAASGSAGGDASKTPPKKVRATGHRSTRAELNAKTEMLNATGSTGQAPGTATDKPAAKAPASAAGGSKSASAGAANADASSDAASKTAAPKKAATKSATAKKASAKKGPPKRSAPKRKAAAAVSAKAPTGTNPPTHGLAAAAMAAGRDAVAIGDKPTGADKKRNLKAKTAAKATAVSRSGAPRIQGHISSQGRRNQAKRSSR